MHPGTEYLQDDKKIGIEMMKKKEKRINQLIEIQPSQ
jgi:hypothetical protein